MSIAPSLKSRIRKLEAAQAAKKESGTSLVGLAERLRRAREEADARTPVEQAVYEVQRINEHLALIDQPEDPQECRAVTMMRRFARRHLEAMASLDDPDVVVPEWMHGPIGGMTVAQQDERCDTIAAKSRQDSNRREAREYLATVELARSAT
jgi:hypothetical protein